MIKRLASLAFMAWAVCAAAPATPADAVKDLAPSGRLRAAINFGNPVLAQKDAATGEAGGVSVALARELGRQLGVPASALHQVEEVDRAGMHVGVAKGSAYDLYLTRALKQAAITRTAGAADAFDLLSHDKVDVVAGVKQPLVDYVKSHPELRLIPGHFMEIDQAMGAPKGHEAGLRFLRGFVEAMKSSGFVAQALQASGQGDATVAPPAP
jgi:polar amino acid transport system substrate-binding protein